MRQDNDPPNTERQPCDIRDFAYGVVQRSLAGEGLDTRIAEGTWS